MWFKGDNFVAVTWKEATIIWDGVVHCHIADKWQEKQTTGDAPTPSKYITAEIIEDKMYLVKCSLNDEQGMQVYRLDIREWRWDRITPGGPQPSEIAFNTISSWAHMDKVYCLVGRKDRDLREALGNCVLPTSNHLICYNTSTNSWEYPEVKGDVPGRKEMPKAIISGDHVFLFCAAAGDLHILDLKSMDLTLVHGSHQPGKLRSELSLGLCQLIVNFYEDHFCSEAYLK